jgi:hypothetical protein
MIRNAHGRPLGIGEAEDFTAWMLGKLTPELRRELMADRPQLYAALYPEVDPAVILAAVDRKLSRKEN